MTVIARDAVASDHLVYAWPFPIGPECEVACSDGEQVVMCPAWLVGDRLGPGRHRWRTPDPTRPVVAFFVLTAPVEVAFDMVTSFRVPTTGQPVRVRAQGSLLVRCADPGLLIAQFVGLPFDHVNDGVLRSVSRSVERMLARLLTRRVVMSGTPIAVTDGGMLPGIIEELISYNPTAGAVFGVELIRMNRLMIGADDGAAPYVALPVQNLDWSSSMQALPPEHANGNGHPPHAAPPAAPNRQYARPQTPPLDTIRGMPAVTPPPPSERTPSATEGAASAPPERPEPLSVASGEIVVPSPGAPRAKKSTLQMPTTAPAERKPSAPPVTASGEILSKPPAVPPPLPPPPRAVAKRPTAPMPPMKPLAAPIEVPGSSDEITQPGIDPRTLTPIFTSPRAAKPAPAAKPASDPVPSDAHGAILGIGMAAIGHGTAPPGVVPGASAALADPVKLGTRVLVPGPSGLMQSATVRQRLQGYYELEVGSSGETVWVPIDGVVPE